MVEKVDTVVEDADDAPTTEDTPTQEQQLETLQTELKAEKEARQKAESSVQGLRGSLTEKDKKLGEQAGITGLRQEVTGLRETLELQAIMLAERGLPEDSEGMSPEVRQAKADVLKKEQKDRRVAEEAETKRQAYNQQAEDVFTRAKEVLKDNPKALREVKTFLYAGDLTEVEAILAEAESTTESKKETDEEVWERINQKKLKDAGKLKTDGVLPSGGSLDDAAFKKGVGSGDLPLNKENMKRAKSLGLA